MALRQLQPGLRAWITTASAPAAALSLLAPPPPGSIARPPSFATRKDGQKRAGLSPVARPLQPSISATILNKRKQNCGASTEAALLVSPLLGLAPRTLVSPTWQAGLGRQACSQPIRPHWAENKAILRPRRLGLLTLTPDPSLVSPCPSRSFTTLSTSRASQPAGNSFRTLRMQRPRTYRLLRFVLLLSSLLLSLYLLSLFFAPLRYLILGVIRCLRVAYAVAGCIIDYKLLFRKAWPEDTEAGRRQRHEDYENTHYSAAHRILAVLRQNGGIYVKLGQHLSSVQLIPTPWSETMKPLQDQCHPTPYEDMDALFRRDIGASIDELFSEFDQKAIGVASLAQVHRAKDRRTGREVAVKIMHPDLEEYSEVDMRTAILMLKVVKWVFPTFEFTWLGEEMQENLPKEMDFRHEASMAERCRQDFAHMRHTTLFIPQVLWSKKRVLVMEYIHGARVDDLEYLAEHKIDRNRVSQEITAIFSRMLYLHGFFHADPHGGNLLIRPAPPGSRSSYNFEVVLLDHGLYFDLPYDLRTNYARLWLSLMKTATPAIAADRRKYAHLVGNIDDTQYAIFESAITGRAGLDGTWDATSASQFDSENPNGKRAGSLLDVGKVDRAEMRKIRDAVVEGGLVTDIFQILRTVPRRLLMVLKVNDLTRSLDHSLHTTHPPARIWLIVARYCGLAVWEDDRKRLREERWREGWSFSWMGRWLDAWIEYRRWTTGLRVIEFSMDVYAGLSKLRLWLRGLRHGLRGAYREAAGLDLGEAADA